MAEKRFITRFYETPAGAQPVRDFLRALPKADRVKCGEYMQRLEWQGFALAASHLKKLDGDIWELRPEYGGVEYRLLRSRCGEETTESDRHSIGTITI